MPVPINPINVPALASYAGNNIGNLGLGKTLNLPVPQPRRPSNLGRELGSGLAGIAHAMSQRANRDRAEATQQRTEARQDSRFDRQMALKERLANSAEKSDEEDRQLKREIFKQKLEIEASKAASVNDEEQLRKKAGAGIVVSMLPDKILNDSKKRNQVFDRLREDGIITKEQQASLTEMKDPDQIRVRAKSWSAIHKEGLKFYRSNAKKKAAEGGSSEETNSANMPLTGPVKNQVQKEMVGLEDEVSRMESIGNKYAEDYLTAGGQIKSTVGNTLSWLGKDVTKKIPFFDSAAYTKFAEDKSAFSSQLGQFLTAYVHRVSGAAYSEKELRQHMKNMINTSDSPAEFKGKYRALMNTLKTGIELRQNLLEHGLKPGSPEYEREFKAKFSTVLEKLSGRQQQTKQYSDDEIDSVATKYNMSRDQVIELMRKKGIR